MSGLVNSSIDPRNAAIKVLEGAAAGGVIGGGVAGPVGIIPGIALGILARGAVEISITLGKKVTVYACHRDCQKEIDQKLDADLKPRLHASLVHLCRSDPVLKKYLQERGELFKDPVKLINPPPGLEETVFDKSQLPADVLYTHNGNLQTFSVTLDQCRNAPEAIAAMHNRFSDLFADSSRMRGFLNEAVESFQALCADLKEQADATYEQELKNLYDSLQNGEITQQAYGEKRVHLRLMFYPRSTIVVGTVTPEAASSSHLLPEAVLQRPRDVPNLIPIEQPTGPELSLEDELRARQMVASMRKAPPKPLSSRLQAKVDREVRKRVILATKDGYIALIASIALGALAAASFGSFAGPVGFNRGIALGATTGFCIGGATHLVSVFLVPPSKDLELHDWRTVGVAVVSVMITLLLITAVGGSIMRFTLKTKRLYVC